MTMERSRIPNSPLQCMARRQRCYIAVGIILQLPNGATERHGRNDGTLRSAWWRDCDFRSTWVHTGPLRWRIQPLRARRYQLGNTVRPNTQNQPWAVLYCTGKPCPYVHQALQTRSLAELATLFFSHSAIQSAHPPSPRLISPRLICAALVAGRPEHEQ